MFKKFARDGSLLYLGIVLMIALCIAFLLPVTPEDFWWYLRVGKETLTSGVIARVDSFTWTAAGQPMFYHSWGSALIFWLVYKSGGLTLIVLLRGLLIAFTYGLLWFTSRGLGAGKWSASLALLAAVLAGSNNWAVRPQLLVYPLFALALWLLYQWQDGKSKSVLWLPLIALAWANLHASFILLIALTTAALIFGKGDKRILGLSFIGILVAIFINPRGWESWQYVVSMLSSSANMQYSAEWGPPINQGWQMNLFFGWLLLFPLLAASSSCKLSRLEWIWFIGFGALALWGTRYVVWFVMLIAVLAARLLSGWEELWAHESKPGNAAINWVMSIILLVLPLAFLPGIRQAWWQQAPDDTQNTPVAAVEWLRVHPEMEGPLLAEMGFASYTEFALPERPVWIDTRVQLFPVAQWQHYVDITYAYDGWENELQATGANLVMVSLTKQPRLASALEKTTNWCERYRDQVAVIYSRGACSAN